MHRLRLAAVAAALALAAGCAPGTATVPVAGDVTLDGQPFGDGSDAYIRFDPADPTTGNSAESFIVGGKYSVQLVPGRYKVSVSWPRRTGEARVGVAGPGAGGEKSADAIPVRYNGSSELTVEVSKEKTKYDFPLTSK